MYGLSLGLIVPVREEGECGTEAAVGGGEGGAVVGDDGGCTESMLSSSMSCELSNLSLRTAAAGDAEVGAGAVIGIAFALEISVVAAVPDCAGADGTSTSILSDASTPDMCALAFLLMPPSLVPAPAPARGSDDATALVPDPAAGVGSSPSAPFIVVILNHSRSSAIKSGWLLDTAGFFRSFRRGGVFAAPAPAPAPTGGVDGGGSAGKAEEDASAGG